MTSATLLVLAVLIGCVFGLRAMIGASPLAFLNYASSLVVVFAGYFVLRWVTVTKHLPDSAACSG
jgi:uncharacterized membrane protein